MTYPVSDHYDGRRFFNPVVAPPQSFAAVPRVLLERRTRWPSRVDTPSRLPAGLGNATLVLTFIGHSTFLIQTPAGHILTDPIYSTCAGPFGRLGPRRVRPPAVKFEDLPPISMVLLSHNHYDHFDMPTLRRLAKRFDPLVVTPLGNARLVRPAGFRRVEELDWWGQASSTPCPVAMTPARHFSARTPFDRDRALWGGFVVHAAGKRIYYAGDSAYSPYFRDVRARFGPIDVALLPIGAYEPRWFMHSIHMNPEEAVQAHLDLLPALSIGMHFGTFQLTNEGIDEPLRALAEACRARGVEESEFRTLDFGESLVIP